MSDNPAEAPEDVEPPDRLPWLTPLAWSLLSLLALLVFELTAEPALSAVVLSSKAGWQDLLTALWLRRVDPNAGRGAACFWFSLMVGVMTICGVAFCLTIAIIVVTVIWVNMGLPVAAVFARHTIGRSIVALFGVTCVTEVLVALLGLTGCIVARRHNVKVWVSPMLHRARLAGQWPPFDASAPDLKNTGDRILVPAIAIAVIGVVFGTLVLVLGTPLPAVPVVLLALVAAAALVWLSRGVTATTISECWPEAQTPAEAHETDGIGIADREADRRRGMREPPWLDDETAPGR